MAPITLEAGKITPHMVISYRILPYFFLLVWILTVSYSQLYIIY